MANRQARGRREQQPDGAGRVGAADAARPWHELKKQVEERRAERPVRLPQVQASLVGRLMDVASLDVCDDGVRGWFTSSNGKLTISAAAPAKVGGWPAIPLK